MKSYYDKYDAAVDIGLEADLANEALGRIADMSVGILDPRADIREGPKDGALRVWWIRNVPNKATHYGVADLVEAMHLFARLMWYDLQREDVESNVGGVEVFHNGDWEEWCDEDTYEDFEILFDAFVDALAGVR